MTINTNFTTNMEMTLKGRTKLSKSSKREHRLT